MAKQHVPVIDFHAHILDSKVLERAFKHSVASGFGKRQTDRSSPNTVKMVDPQRQIADMDSRGVDMHVISSATIIEGLWWAEPREALELDQRLNDGIAGWVSQYPTRFAGCFTVPLQDLELALGELHRAVKQLGLRVANLPANVGGVYLGEPRFHPLWAEIRELGVTAFIHPDGVKDEWFQNYGMWNSIGQSIEETKVMTSLIYEGIFEKFPGVKVVMAHGGGYMAHYMGRLDRNVTNIPASMKNITKKPSEYLRNFYYDSCVFDPLTLEFLIRRVGADRIVMASDYPVADVAPLDFMRTIQNLGPAEFDMIVGGNAAHLLKLERTTAA